MSTTEASGNLGTGELSHLCFDQILLSCAEFIQPCESLPSEVGGSLCNGELFQSPPFGENGILNGEFHMSPPFAENGILNGEFDKSAPPLAENGILNGEFDKSAPPLAETEILNGGLIQPCLKPIPEVGDLGKVVNGSGFIQLCLGQQKKQTPEEPGGGFLDSDEFSPSCRKQLKDLQAVLRQLKLPPILDRRHTPRSGEDPQVTVVLMAELEEVLNIFLVGNEQCPDGFLYVPTVSWLLRGPSDSDNKSSSGAPRAYLYVRQAITKNAGGQTYLDVFCPPRRVTYLDNLLHSSVTMSGEGEGEQVGRLGLDTPACGSLELNARVDDKLLTATMCAAVGVPHPVTLGLWLPGGKYKSYQHPECYPTVTVVRLAPPGVDQDKERLLDVIQNFLGSSLMTKHDKVVVKPYGPAWNQCRGVTYHVRTNVTSILSAVLDLLTHIKPGSGILVQSYHATFAPEAKTSNLGRHSIDIEGLRLGFRVRAIVVRSPDNEARMTQVVCAINDGSRPIGGVITVPTSLPFTLRRWGMGEARQQAIYRDIRDTCERLTGELIRQELRLTEQERGGHCCHTELVGIDLILTKEKDEDGGDILRPVVIEVNAHDCLYHATVMELMHPQMKGKAVTPLAQTMIQRSEAYLLSGSTVVVIGTGGYSKRKLWSDAPAAWGVKLVLVDSDPSHPANGVVDTFLHLDITDHTQDPQHAAAIIRLLRERLPTRQVVGCLTWVEDCVPLAAHVAQCLGLPLGDAPSVEAAVNAKSKAKTHLVLNELGQPPHDLPLSVYSSPVAMVNSVEMMAEAVEKVSLPAVLKLEFGSSAVGVQQVHSVQEAQEYMAVVQSTLHREEDHPGVGLGHGQSMVLMPRVQGTEHDVDLVIFQDQVVAAFLSDNGPTRLPFCGETAALMPSVLPAEQKRQLIAAAASCCRALGLHSGVFNVEMINTSRGPRLMEINARMGGFYLRDWILRLYGADLFHMALLVACGIRPVLTGRCSLDEEDPPLREDCDCELDCGSTDGVFTGLKPDGQGLEKEMGRGEGLENGYISSLEKEMGRGEGLENGYISSLEKEMGRGEGLENGYISSDTGLSRARALLAGGRKRRRDWKDSGKSCIMGIQLYPSRHAQALATTATPQLLQRLHEEGRVVFTQMEPEVEEAGDGTFEEPYGNLAVQAACLHQARAQLVSICVSLGLETEESISEVLSDFVDIS